MYLKRLYVYETEPEEKEIREIFFRKKGISFIVNDIEEKTDGNNIGKTTTSRIIDLCLGARNKNTLFYDMDTNSTNFIIQNYLNKKKVVALLVVSNHKNDFYFKRQLFNNGASFINDIKYSYPNYCKELKKIFFNDTQLKPTLRQIMPKFVRINNNTVDNSLHFIPDEKSIRVYHAVYSFLFNFFPRDIISKISNLETQKRDLTRDMDAFKNYKNQTESILDQSIGNERQNLNQLEKEKEHLSYMEKYKKEIEQLKLIDQSINMIETEINDIEFSQELLLENLSKMENEKKDFNFDWLNEIYKEASLNVKDLTKSFEDLVNFNNKMLNNKINFYNIEIAKLESRKKLLAIKLNELKTTEKEFADISFSEGLFSSLEELNNKEKQIHEKIGRLYEARDRFKETKEKIEKIDNQLSEINSENPTIRTKLTEKILFFNSLLKEICEEFFDIQYQFTYDFNWQDKKTNKFPAKLDSIDGNEDNISAGRKKAIVVAFDIAYFLFAKSKNIICPNFMIYDKVELLSQSSLTNIVKYCENYEGQLIIPILSNELSSFDEEKIKELTILKLSKSSKFFKI